MRFGNHSCCNENRVIVRGLEAANLLLPTNRNPNSSLYKNDFSPNNHNILIYYSCAGIRKLVCWTFLKLFQIFILQATLPYV